MEILKIEREKQLLIKYYVKRHLILLKIKNMMDMNMDLLQWCINFFIKKLPVGRYACTVGDLSYAK